MEEHGEPRQKVVPSDSDFSRNVGQIFGKFEWMSLDQKVMANTFEGSGELVYQISKRFFILATCAHNFV